MTIKQIEQSIEGLDIDKALEKLYFLKSEFGDKVDRIIEKYEKKKLKHEKELNRYLGMCEFEKEAYQRGFSMIAGIDEVGRGPLAGPVVAAAVILPQDAFIEGLNDSKKLNENQRERLFDVINDKALGVGLGIVDEKQIDEINILNATKAAMKLAVQNLDLSPDILFIDSLRLDDIHIVQNSIVKGDAKSVSIAAASIVAKVTRDRMLKEMDKEYPMYGFSKHKGYGTSEHIEAIKKYGICPIHRVSFTKNFVI